MPVSICTTTCQHSPTRVIGGEDNVHHDRWPWRRVEEKQTSCCPRVGQSRHLMGMPLFEKRQDRKVVSLILVSEVRVESEKG